MSQKVSNVPYVNSRKSVADRSWKWVTIYTCIYACVYIYIYAYSHIYIYIYICDAVSSNNLNQVSGQ